MTVVSGCPQSPSQTQRRTAEGVATYISGRKRKTRPAAETEPGCPARHAGAEEMPSFCYFGNSNPNSNWGSVRLTHARGFRGGGLYG